ncbi:MAG: COX15/CtaA family protein [Planctomycetota bacterium]
MDTSSPAMAVDLGEAAASSPLPSARLRGFAVAVVIATLVLIKAGAMVTSTGSGLAYLDWPLANRSWWPPNMGLDGLLEHGHRAIGATIGLLVLILTVWVGLAEKRNWLRWLAIGALGLVVLQGVIGGLGVLERLPALTSVAHGVLAQVVLCVLTLIAFALSAHWQPCHAAPAAMVNRARWWAGVGVALVFAQLVAGAILRHTGWTGMLWLHIFNAIVVAFGLVLAALYCGTRFGDHGFRGLSRAVGGLVLLQLMLGFVTLGVRRVKDPSNIEYLGSSVLVTSHVVVGAVLFLTSSLLLYRALRNLEPIPA